MNRIPAVLSVRALGAGLSLLVVIAFAGWSDPATSVQLIFGLSTVQLLGSLCRLGLEVQMVRELGEIASDSSPRPTAQTIGVPLLATLVVGLALGGAVVVLSGVFGWFDSQSAAVAFGLAIPFFGVTMLMSDVLNGLLRPLAGALRQSLVFPMALIIWLGVVFVIDWNVRTVSLAVLAAAVSSAAVASVGVIPLLTGWSLDDVAEIRARVSNGMRFWMFDLNRAILFWGLFAVTLPALTLAEAEALAVATRLALTGNLLLVSIRNSIMPGLRVEDLEGKSDFFASTKRVIAVTALAVASLSAVGVLTGLGLEQFLPGLGAPVVLAAILSFGFVGRSATVMAQSYWGLTGSAMTSLKDSVLALVSLIIGGVVVVIVPSQTVYVAAFVGALMVAGGQSLALLTESPRIPSVRGIAASR